MRTSQLLMHLSFLYYKWKKKRFRDIKRLIQGETSNILEAGIEPKHTGLIANIYYSIVDKQIYWTPELRDLWNYIVWPSLEFYAACSVIVLILQIKETTTLGLRLG